MPSKTIIANITLCIFKGSSRVKWMNVFMALPTEIWRRHRFSAVQRRSRSSLWCAPLCERRPAGARTRSARSTRCPSGSNAPRRPGFATRRRSRPDRPTRPCPCHRRTADPRNWPVRFVRSTHRRTKPGWMRLGARGNAARRRPCPPDPNPQPCPRTLRRRTRWESWGCGLGNPPADKWGPRWGPTWLPGPKAAGRCRTWARIPRIRFRGNASCSCTKDAGSRPPRGKYPEESLRRCIDRILPRLPSIYDKIQLMLLNGSWITKCQPYIIAR